MNIPAECVGGLQKLGLYQVSQFGFMRCDGDMMAALVERWRPETHTFHFGFGEMTVTLQDVACLWGLPVRGPPVTGIMEKD